MADRLAQLTQAKIDRAINDYAALLSNGGAADYPAYREIVGTIKGLVLSKEIRAEAEKELMEQ